LQLSPVSKIGLLQSYSQDTHCSPGLQEEFIKSKFTISAKATGTNVKKNINEMVNRNVTWCFLTP